MGMAGQADILAQNQTHHLQTHARTHTTAADYSHTDGVHNTQGTKTAKPTKGAFPYDP